MELSCHKLKKILYFQTLSVGRTFRKKCEINKVTLKKEFLILVRASRQYKMRKNVSIKRELLDSLLRRMMLKTKGLTKQPKMLTSLKKQCL